MIPTDDTCQICGEPNLRARVAKLEAALRPIAEKQTWRDKYPDMELNPQQEELSCLIAVEHIYNARAVLAKGREG